MSATNKKLTAAVENYFSDLASIRASGGATSELSYHAVLANLLNAVGAARKEVSLRDALTHECAESNYRPR